MSMFLFDAHAHVTSRKFDQDRAQVIERARAAGVLGFIEVGCDLDESKRAADFAAANAERAPYVWASVGVHPHEAKLWDERSAGVLRELAGRPRVVAIGETGLDYYYDHSPRDVQRRVFEAQLELAKELDRPVVLHIRDAHEEALEVLAAHSTAKLRGIAHCFSTGLEVARRYNALRFAISVGGLATFKSAPEVMTAAAGVALDQLLLETDCPFMAPMPHRGKRCEPMHVAATCEAIAKARGIPAAELARATRENTARIFGLTLPAA